MNDLVIFRVDSVEVHAKKGETIMQAADGAGIYIPRLCDEKGLEPQGSCRVCTVKLNGRTVASCTQPAVDGAEVENDTEELRGLRRDLVRMLYHEGNHLCPGCEASGRCELQALGYYLGILQPDKYPYLQPVRPVDASHKDILLDTNRCIRCGRCIRSSLQQDHKGVFGYIGRGLSKQVGVNGPDLAHTNASVDDHAVAVGTCPVGCIIQKRIGFSVPIGARRFDLKPVWKP